MRSGTIAILILAALGPVGSEKPVAAQPPDIPPELTPMDFVVEDFADVSDCRTLERRGPALLSLTNESQLGQSWAVWKWQRQPLQDKHRSLYEGQPYLADLWPPFYLLPGQPRQVHLQVRGDGQGVQLRAALLDAQEEVFYFDLGTVDFQDWRDLSVSLDQVWKSGEGHVNGKLDFPLRFDALIAEVPGGIEQFEIGLADLTVTTGVEEDERLALGVWTSDGRTVHQEAAEPFKFRLRVANLFDKQRSADISWTVQREGHEVARAEQTVRLDAGESTEMEWPFEAEKAGIYALHAQARSEKVHREQTLRVRVGPPQPDPRATIDADVGEHGELIEVRVNGQVMLRNFEFALLGPQYQLLGRNGVEHFQPVQISEEEGARVFEDTFGDEKFQVRSRVAVRVTPDQISLDYAFTSEASLTLWQLSIGGWMPCRETDESFFFVGPERREFPGGIPSWPLFLQYRKEGEIGWFRETGEGLRCRPRWPRQPYIFLEDYRWRYNYGDVLRFVPVLYGELKPGQTVRFGLELEPIREWPVESVTRDQAPPPAKDPAAWQTSTPAPPPFQEHFAPFRVFVVQTFRATFWRKPSF
jgi:hypothetical protein